MADQKISELTALTGANVADDDAIAIVDTSATETKKIVFSELKNALDTATGFVRITGDTMTGALDVQSTITADGLTMGDGHSLALGDSSEFTITHTAGGNTNLSESGSGNLNISARDLFVQDIAGTNRLKVDGNLGDISFYDSLGTTPKFFWDASAESLGIGTSSPSQALSVESSSVGVTRVSVTNTGNAAAGAGVQFITKNGATQVSNATLRTDNAGNFSIFTGTTGETERMRIDSSGNLLVGKTFSSSTEDGLELRSTNVAVFTRDGGNPLGLNRKSSDGDIIVFNKDGSTVGSIGTLSGNVTIGTGDTGVQFNQDTNAVMPHNISTGANVDASIDLGYSSGGTNRRFKDLYLSGGVYLGGTGAANKLDDYEEGTFTPTFTSSSGTLSVGYSSQVGRYTKIGRMVHVTVDIQASGAQSGGSGIVRVSGFPFNFKNGPTLHAGAVAFSNNWVSSEAPSHISGEGNTGFATLRRFDGNSEVNDSVGVGAIQTNSRVYFQITYEADGG